MEIRLAIDNWYLLKVSFTLKLDNAPDLSRI
jgi:hypothetical protein